MKYVVDGSQMTSLADAIRSMTGSSAPLTFPEGMISAVETGGGGDLSDYILGNLSEFNDTQGLVLNAGITGSPLSRNLAFMSQSQLSSIALPSCKTLYSYAFYDLPELTYLSLPEMSIARYKWCLYNLPKLSELYLPKCKTIGYEFSSNSYSQVIANCASLSLIDAPELTTIGYYAFVVVIVPLFKLVYHHN